ncbi:MAG: type II toxin-antitoxin system Phd/YefM family antitoxin [Candidatus Peribacteraceae bacterium]|nr:type II toxin-antitoxin system Phd/YefM family antitoxin [Candidatus Peribacteraceae bacterium]
MFKDISIKDLRTHLAEFANRVESGESFRVIRRSKPSFYIMKIDDSVDIPTMDQWETVIDFTDNGNSEGVELGDVLTTLRKINNK